MGNENARPPDDNKGQQPDVTSSEPELRTLRAGEELLRKAHTVSHEILRRFRNAIRSGEQGPAEDVALLADAFRRFYKVRKQSD
jgi:hypothetical protein